MFEQAQVIYKARAGEVEVSNRMDEVDKVCGQTTLDCTSSHSAEIVAWVLSIFEYYLKAATFFYPPNRRQSPNGVLALL